MAKNYGYSLIRTADMADATEIRGCHRSKEELLKFFVWAGYMTEQAELGAILASERRHRMHIIVKENPGVDWKSLYGKWKVLGRPGV